MSGEAEKDEFVRLEDFIAPNQGREGSSIVSCIKQTFSNKEVSPG